MRQLMHHPDRRRVQRSKSQDERGTALIEAAIILPVVSVFLFGVIEFSFAFKASLSVSSAVRAGARIGSAEPRQSTFYTDIKKAVEVAAVQAGGDPPVEMWIYSADANGFPVDAGGTMNCVGRCQKFDTWNTTSKSFTNPAAPANYTTTWTTGSAGNQGSCQLPGQPIESVGVYLKVSHRWVTGMFSSSPTTLTDKAIARLEPTPPGQLGC